MLSKINFSRIILSGEVSSTFPSPANLFPTKTPFILILNLTGTLPDGSEPLA